ncbi:MAG: MFS transporter [Actinomycetes bacterium]
MAGRGPAVAEASRARFRDALSHRDFRLLTASFVVDAVGSWAYSVVLAVYLYERTGSSTVVALSAASRWVPAVLCSAYASVLADRYERTLVLRVSAAASAVVMAVLAVGVAVDAPVWLLLALSVVSAAVFAPYNPAAQALTPEVVSEKDLAAANGLFSTLENAVVVVGPLIGGAVLVVASPVVGIAFNIVSFLVAIALLTQLRVRSTGSAAQDGGNALTQWLVGVRTVLEHRTAFVLVLFCALDSAVYGAATVIYVPLSERVGTGAEGYSYLLAGGALGGVLGAFAANRLSASSRLAPVILISILVQTTPFLLTLLVDRPLAAFALQVVSGSGMIVVDVLAITALQRELPREVLGRVFGVFDAVVIGAITTASLVGALVLSVAGLDAALLAVGLGIPALALLGLPVLLRTDRAAAAVADQLRPRVELLSVLDLLAGVDRTTLERLAKAAEERTVPPRTAIITEGEEADALWVLVSGSLTVRAKGVGARAKQLPTVHAPGYVGELGLLNGRPRTATVRARETSTLLRIDGSEFLDALKTSRASASLMSIAGTRMARTARLHLPARVPSPRGEGETQSERDEDRAADAVERTPHA